MEQWRLPVQKAWLREWRRLIRVIQTAFITFSAGKWEAIYFYNLAYIYAELSLCILPGPHFHSVMSVSAGWTQYRLIRNYLHFLVCLLTASPIRLMKQLEPCIRKWRHNEALLHDPLPMRYGVISSGRSWWIYNKIVRNFMNCSLIKVLFMYCYNEPEDRT